MAEIDVLLKEWFDEKLSIDDKVKIVEKKIKEVDVKVQQLKKVKKFLLQAKRDVENGFC